MDSNKIQIVQVQLNELTEIINEIIASQLNLLVSNFNQDNSEKPDKDLLSRKEVSELLGLSLVTLSKYHKNNTLRGVKMPNCKRIYYWKADVYSLLNQNSS